MITIHIVIKQIPFLVYLNLSFVPELGTYSEIWVTF
jgi:hypothetical protein